MQIFMVNTSHTIALDKRWYQVNIFFLSLQKHMLWCSLKVPCEALFISTTTFLFNVCCGFSLEMPW